MQNSSLSTNSFIAEETVIMIRETTQQDDVTVAVEELDTLLELSNHRYLMVAQEFFSFEPVL